MKIRLFFFSIVFSLSFLILSTFSLAQASKAALDGSFITGDLCGFWTDARWQEEFSSMKAAGMHYIIIQAVADSYPGKVTTTLYPSSLPNTQMANYPDIVDACLRNAESAGMKVFIGIDMSSNWWNVYGNDSTWLYNQMEFDNQICDELWKNYKDKYPNAFYGWYWSYEVDNLNFVTTAQQKVLTKAMNIQLDHLISTNEKLPFMWCPFMNSRLGVPQAYETMWKNVFAGLHTTDGDIFCPQDCVGAGGLKLNEVASWFSALRQAVDTKPGLLMWSDVETFEGLGSSFISASIGRVVTQLKTEQPYVDDYVSWEYCYYDSPFNTDSGYQATYLDYLNTGEVETTPPSTPANFSAVLLPSGDAELTWDASTDNIGICGYNIYRNGELINKTQVPITKGVTENDTLPTNYIDRGLISNTTYAYQIKAYDFAGNISSSTPADTITTPNYIVASHNCRYTLSVTPSSSYPDPSRTKLTDGIFASQAYYADPAWVGFISTDTLNVVIDLGKTTPVQQFLGEYLLDPQPAVFLPTKILLSISTDNLVYTNLDSLQDSGKNVTTSSIHKYYCKLSNPVNARYVKFSTVAPAGAWIFVDEYEVISSVASSVKQLTTGPLKFELGNNYPNPFNPSTKLNVSLRRAGIMSLKIYNLLGQLVKVVDEGYKPAGTYSYNVNMNNFASGVYLYRLREGNNMMTKKMTLLK